jgi:protein-disulfide isomerase
MSSRNTSSRTQPDRVAREQTAADARRKRNLWTTLVAVSIVVIAGLIAWGVVASQRATDFETPANATADGTGLVVGTGPTKVDIYFDFMCPHCRAFEDSAGSTIDQMVADGRITVNYHPIAILDRASSTRYSTRSAGAAGCAADFGKTAAYVPAVFKRQPAEGSAGLSDDTLIEIGGTVGLTDPAFASCVRDGKYKTWATHNTDEAGKKDIHSTPTVLVAGKEIDPTAQALAAAVNGAG